MGVQLKLVRLAWQLILESLEGAVGGCKEHLRLFTAVARLLFIGTDDIWTQGIGGPGRAFAALWRT